jgi:hypothetical protein
MIRMLKVLYAAAMFVPVPPIIAAQHAKPSSRGQTANASEQQRECQLEVDGKVMVAGRCWVYPMGAGDYTLNTRDHRKPHYPHFAMVSSNGDGTANVTWNADPTDDRASDPLGKARKRGGCWVNERVRICAR